MADLALARRVLETEAAAILALVERLDARFDRAIDLLRCCRGRVILTGMGTDGAKGLLAVRQAKGATLAQDDHSSVVFGMPKAAIEIGAACEVLPLGGMAAAIRGLAGWRPPSTQGVQHHE